MKYTRHLFFLFYLSLLFLSTSCSTLQGMFAGAEDARQAFQMDEAHVRTYKFNDIMSLKIILGNTISSYQQGMAYLRKEMQKESGKAKTDHERALAKLDRSLNIIEAHIENLSLLYPDEWVKEKEDLDLLFIELYRNYRDLYLSLNPV